MSVLENSCEPKAKSCSYLLVIDIVCLFRYSTGEVRSRLEARGVEYLKSIIAYKEYLARMEFQSSSATPGRKAFCTLTPKRNCYV